MLTYLLIFSVLFFGNSHTAARFPLNNCDTGQFDIIVVQTKLYLGFILTDSLKFFRDMWPQGNRADSSRVRVSGFDASLLENRYTCDSKLVTYDDRVINMCDGMKFVSSLELNSTTILEDMSLKVKIAVGFFLDMGFGRKNSTLIAVIFINSWPFKTRDYEGIENRLYAFQENTSQILLFIIVENHNDSELKYLGNIIIAQNPLHYSPMALCSTCPSGWLSFKRKRTGEITSCYELEVLEFPINGLIASGVCTNKHGYSTTVESQDELEQLQEQLLQQLLPLMQPVHGDRTSVHYSAEVYIGLRRESGSIAARFRWVHPRGSRPLVMNHWLSGQPAGGFSKACGVWVFSVVLNETTGADNELEHGISNVSMLTRHTDGWASVGCGIRSSLLNLCEFSLSQYVIDENNITIPPASTDSFSKVINRGGEFVDGWGSIVSISSYANYDSSYGSSYGSFSKDNFQIPRFDCGEEASNPRYISYSFICDCIAHCSNRRDEMTCSGLQYTVCRSGQCIPKFAKCDIIKDCDDGSDEEDCPGCRGGSCCDGTCLPKHLFNDQEIDCSECKTTNNLTYHDESTFFSEFHYNKETCAFECTENTCVYPSTMDFMDYLCTTLGSMNNKNMQKLERAASCYNALEALIWAPKCVYIRDKFGAVLGCRDLSHLQNCSDFTCQEGYYKCPGSYCVPIHYFLDKKIDCPEGEDERPRVNETCAGNFLCWNSQVCLHPDLVCDEHPDCPNKDDELNCDVPCPDGLRCIAGTVTVNNSSSFTSRILMLPYETTTYVDLSGLNLSNVPGSEYKCSKKIYDVRFSRCSLKDYKFPLAENCLKNIYRADLSYNHLTLLEQEVYPFSSFYHLRELNLSFNINIELLGDIQLQLLTTLDLSHTGLVNVHENVFINLPKLQHLNLSHTKLSQFCVQKLPRGFTLQTLDLRGAPIEVFQENTFKGLVVTTSVHADNYGMCCPQIRGSGILGDLCHAFEDPISSCYDLISQNIQRIFLWVMAVTAIIGNLTVILYRLIGDENVLRTAYGLFVLNLSISDLIMGIYLLIIAVADICYRSAYILYDKNWRESIFCKIAGFLATLSSETSAFFILLITVDRFLVLKFPYGQVKFSKVTKTIAIVLAWLIGFVLAVIPVLPIFGKKSILSTTAMCVGLPLGNQQVNGWEYSLSVFIVLNFILLLFIAIGQLAIFRSISTNRVPKETMNQNSLRRAQDITVAKQLSLVVLSDFLCWFPVGLMGFMSLSGHKISNDVIAWTIIFVLPVNSAINPLLYTIPVLMVKWEKFKFGTPKVVS